MNVLMIASEFEGFAKTGGLADAVRGLSLAMSEKGYNVKIVMPRYYEIDKSKLNDLFLPVGVNMGTLGTLWCGVFERELNANANVYFVDYERYFGRKGLYDDEHGNPYVDNGERFVFLSKAAIEISKALGFKPDIIHAHDWHASFALISLKTSYLCDEFFKNTAGVLTIHNLQHQGVFNKTLMNVMGIDWMHFNPFELEALGAVNLLKGGIYFADAISTVSKQYAKEIQTPEYGFGLDEHLKAHSYKLFGILNGVDYSSWNPKTDPFIAKNYDIDSIEDKIYSKRDLQSIFGLEVNDKKPLIGFIGRLYEQKGIRLIVDAFDELMSLDCEFVLLGSGEKWAEEFFSFKANQHRNKFGCYIGYSNEIAHKIEAGCDMFLMPSVFEPCGLNQIYSMRYGTLPIVRATGGLKDTVENFDKLNNKGTGFVFWDANPLALKNTVKWAIDVYKNYKDAFKNMQLRAMSKDFSWQKQSEYYVYLYNFAYAVKKLKYD